METRRFIESLVPEVAHNASVVRIEEARDVVQITVAGTTSVEARCEVPRQTVTDASENDLDARRRLASMLKACADRTIASIPDGRS